MISRLEQVLSRLENFDWFFERSDDMSTWRRANKELSELRYAVGQINNPKLNELFQAYMDYKDEKGPCPDTTTYFPDWKRAEEPAKVEYPNRYQAHRPKESSVDPEPEVPKPRRPWPGKSNKLTLARR